MLLGHKVYDEPTSCGPCPNRIRFDIGAGARIQLVDARIGTAAVAPIDVSQTWADPIIATRLRYTLRERWVFEGDGDIGGFGVNSEITWRVRLTVAWQPVRWFNVQAGYVWLDTDFTTGAGAARFKWDVLLQGPYIGVGFTL